VSLLSGALCPRCGGDLAVGCNQEPIACGSCSQVYPRAAGIPVLLPNAEQHVALWRRQLGLLLERGSHTRRALTDAAGAPGLLEVTRLRLSALGRAVQDQVDDVARLLEPCLGEIGLPIRQRRLPLGIFVDSAPLSRTGGAALTIGRLTWNTLRRIHTPADTADGLSLEVAQRVGRAVAQIDL